MKLWALLLQRGCVITWSCWVKQHISSFLFIGNNRASEQSLKSLSGLFNVLVDTGGFTGELVGGALPPFALFLLTRDGLGRLKDGLQGCWASRKDADCRENLLVIGNMLESFRGNSYFYGRSPPKWPEIKQFMQVWFWSGSASRISSCSLQSWGDPLCMVPTAVSVALFWVLTTGVKKVYLFISLWFFFCVFDFFPLLYSQLMQMFLTSVLLPPYLARKGVYHGRQLIEMASSPAEMKNVCKRGGMVLIIAQETWIIEYRR